MIKIGSNMIEIGFFRFGLLNFNRLNKNENFIYKNILKSHFYFRQSGLNLVIMYEHMIREFELIRSICIFFNLVLFVRL